jgi:MFS family permease
MQTRYIVVLGACTTQFMVIGLLFSFGLYIKEFEAEFGWSRTLLSSCWALAFFMMGALAMVGGRLSDRFGPAPVLAVNGVLYGLGFILMSQVSQPWQLFVIFGTFLGLGLSTHDVVTLSTVARWFENRRGIMTAVVKVGTAFGQMALPPLAALLILGVGWQWSLIVLGGLAAVLLLGAALVMQRPPVQSGTDGKLAVAPGLDFAQARATRTFWTMCAIQFLFFPALMTVPLHLAVHGMDLGLSPTVAATLLSVIGAASIAGRLATGQLVDLIGGRNAFAMCFAALILGLTGLLLVSAPVMLFGVIAIYGFAHGGLFVVVSPTAAEFFGMRALGAVFGTIVFFGTVGGSLMPIVAGYVFDTTGSYFHAFLALLIMACVGLALVLSLPGHVRSKDEVAT